MLAKRSRLAIAIILVIGVSIALFASLSRNQITYFYTVAEVLQDKENFQKKKIRVLGLVEKGTVHWSAKDTTLEFFITENGKDKLRVFYTGIKPDLFREGQGAVVEGVMQGENFAAATLLVKHSEEYRVENHDQKKSNYLKSITSLVIAPLNFSWIIPSASIKKVSGMPVTLSYVCKVIFLETPL